MHVLRTRFFPLLLVGVACATPTPVVAPSPVFEPAPATSPTPPTDDEADFESVVRELRFEPDGRVRVTRTTVVTVRANVPSDDLATVSAMFDPWVDERPVLQAKVTTPDGRTLTLDPKTITEAAAPHGSSTFSDRRMVRAPLPGVVKGAKIERTVISNMHRPLVSGAGANGIIPLGWSVPVGRVVVVLDAPTSMPLSHRVEGLPGLKPKTRVEGDRTILTFERENVAAFHTEDGAPWFDPYWPTLAYGSGASWKATAGAYAKIVEPLLDPAPVAANAREAIGDARTDADKVNRIAGWVHRRVRYAAIELGEASMVPTAPKVTLERGYGDCKALSALVVAMARAVDVEADVAVLLASNDTDIGELTPGFGAFNHAIVRVDGDQVGWLDPTWEVLGLGELPPADQARRALRIRDGVLGLEITPRQKSGDALHSITYEYDFAENAPGTMRRTEVTRGYPFHRRRDIARTDPKALVSELGDWGRKTFHPPDGGVSVSHSDPLAIGAPFQTVVELATGEAGIGDWSGATDLVVDELLHGLPDEATTTDAPRRRKSFRWQVPVQTSMEWRLRYPKAFAPAPPPKDARLSLGPATIEVSVGSKPGETTMRAVFDSHDALYTATELQAFRDALGKALDQALPSTFRIENEAIAKVSRGEVQGALAAAREGVRSQPSSPRRRAELAEALVAARAVPLARREVAKGLEAHPDSPGLNRLASTLVALDDWGLPARERDHAAAVARAERAVSLDPWSPRSADNLIDLYFVGDDWRRLGSGALLPKARAFLEDWRRVQRDGSRSHRFDGAYAEALYFLKADAELADPKLDLRGNLEMRALVMAARIRSQGPVVAELATLPDDVGKVEPAMVVRLMKEGDVAPARAWLEHLTKTKPFNEARAALLAKVVTMQSNLSGDPRLGAMRAAYAALVRQDLEAIERVTVPPHAEAVGHVQDTLVELAHELEPLFGGSLSPDHFANVVVGSNAWTNEAIEGVGTLFLTQRIPGLPQMMVLVVPSEGGPRVHLGSFRHSLLGWEATQCLRRGDRVGAARWVALEFKINSLLDRAFAELKGEMAHDEFVELMAWSMAIPDDDGGPGGAIRSLEAWLEREKRVPVRTRVLLELVDGYRASRNGAGMLRLAQEASRGDANREAGIRFEGLIFLGRYREAAQLAAESIKVCAPGERQVWLHRTSHALAMAQDIPAAVKATKAALVLAASEPSLVLRDAWLQVFSKPTASVLAQARLSTQVAKVDPMQRSLVLAVLAAEAGETDAALEHLSGAIHCLQDPKSVWSGAIHYALGRIFEQLDLRDEAIAELKRVDRNPHNTEYDVTSLAKARLSALQAPASVKQRPGTTGAGP